MTLGVLDNVLETLQRFREDKALYFAATLMIRNKDAKVQYLELNEAQRITHAAIEKQLQETGRVRAIILKARQEGISTYVAARFFHSIHLYFGIVAMVVADSLDRAGALSDIYNRYYENLPQEIKPRRKAIERRRYLAFGGDSEISVRPSSDTEAGRALTLHRLHASELAYWGPTARETWNSLMQAVPAAGSEIIIESTAKGAGGLFHELWEDAQNPASGWLPIFLPWWIHTEYEFEPDQEMRSSILASEDDFERLSMTEGIPYRGKLYTLSPRKLAWRRRQIVEAFGGNPSGLYDPANLGKDAVREFQREYPATAEEAFLVSGSCFFDEDVLRKLKLNAEEEVIRGRLLLEEGQDGRKIWVEKNVRGALQVWEYPSPIEHYVIGADTAEGKLVTSRRSERSDVSERGGRDYSSATVLKLGRGDIPPKVVAELHGQLTPEIFAQQLNLLGEYYSCGGTKVGTYENKALVGVEQSHSSGQTVLRLLREHHRYVPLYWHREINRLTRKIGRRIGWRTDAVSRMPMLDDLAALVRANQIDIPGQDLVREMITFVTWPDGKPQAEEGCHDDRVIALAIAVQMMREHRHSLVGRLPVYEIDEESLVG